MSFVEKMKAIAAKAAKGCPLCDVVTEMESLLSEEQTIEPVVISDVDSFVASTQLWLKSICPPAPAAAPTK